ncbi:LysR family transcriptional regulator [Methylophaga sp.]|uniref:LysR family transcriptional regulator n=1 Tax=Methylophaga sp. TaxID=2024840 RepID=UPI003A924D54
MDTIDSMKTFLQVIESGSFTKAAERLETSSANVSRAISALEQHLSTRLLHRTTRRIALTEAGQRYLLRCEQILANVEEAEAEARDAQMNPVGRLRLHTMPALANKYIVKAVTAYRELYPAVSFDITLANRIPDLIEEGIDVSIIMAPQLSDSSLISKIIGQTYSILCVSPDYLAEYGMPTTPTEVEAHQCIKMASTVLPLDHWEMTSDHGDAIIEIKNSPFQVNVSSTVKEAILHGMGIGMVPIFNVTNELASGSLIRVLPNYRGTLFNVYALYPSRAYLDAKTSSWVDFLRDNLPDALARDCELQVN